MNEKQPITSNLADLRAQFNKMLAKHSWAQISSASFQISSELAEPSLPAFPGQAIFNSCWPTKMQASSAVITGERYLGAIVFSEPVINPNVDGAGVRTLAASEICFEDMLATLDAALRQLAFYQGIIENELHAVCGEGGRA